MFEDIVHIDDFSELRECDYKGEHYSVRDNGAILRHARDGKAKRKLDNIWTFGNKDDKNGYMIFCGIRVHIVVATAFYGAHDSTRLVVDHIDTNRCNNRANNLRWLTRLENALNNPATRKKITYLCGGDIQKFLDDPSCLRDSTGTNQDVMWMRTVSSEEAKASYERVMSWAVTPSSDVSSQRGIMGEWIFRQKKEEKSYNSWANTLDEEQKLRSNVEIPNVVHVIFTNGLGEDVDYIITHSKTITALQGNWKTPTEFLCCPNEITATPLSDYFENLKVGATYARNQYGESKVLDLAISSDRKHVWVLSEQQDAVKPWAVSEIVMHENHFLHLSRGTFFSEVGGRKYFIVEQGKEWNGEDCIDDYC